MNSANLKLSEQLVNPSYIKLAENSLNKRQNILKELLSQRQLPDEGLDHLTIQYILNVLALMDSNNFYNKCGVGQRESRIYSEIVKKRHFYMGHGIGRSGDIMANQPKAAGSSLLLQLTKYLTLSALDIMNYGFVQDVLLLPLATGMALTMALLTMKQQRPNAKYVIWPRIDQKTCLKCISTANLTPIVIQNIIKNDQLTTDLDTIQKKIQELGKQNILCILSTTSCFAPRIPDAIQQISLICKKYDIYHLLNNAYGLQCSKIANKVKESLRLGKLDCVVQSTDKNFMVPVGGSIIFTQDKILLKKISQKYPGRACGSPIVDLFITFLQMGKQGLKKIYKDRKENFLYMKQKANEFMKKHDERILETKQNGISMALTLGKILQDFNQTQLGSILYSKKVMGHRILTTKPIQKVCNIEFMNYGTHHNQYPFLPYITVACAIGTTKTEIDNFFQRLHGSLKEIKKKKQKKQLSILTSTTKQQNKQKEIIDNLDKKQ